MWIVPWAEDLYEDLYYQKDIQVIEERSNEFFAAINQDRLEEAYDYMSPQYRRAYTFQDFEDSDLMYTLREQIWNPSFKDVRIKGDHPHVYGGWLKEMRLPLGFDFEMKKVNEEWFFTGEIRHRYD